MKLQFKYLIHYQLFQDKWKFSTCFNAYQVKLKKLATFLDEKYPNLNSLLDLEIEKAEKERLFWLNSKGVKTMSTQNTIYGEYTNKTVIANVLRNIYETYLNLVDTREEWEKDCWDVRILNEKYGLEFNKSKTTYNIIFSEVSNLHLKMALKQYCQQRLKGRNNFSVSSAQRYSRIISSFLNFITRLEPQWNDLKELSRKHIEEYVDFVNDHAHNKVKRKDSNPLYFIVESITTTEKFLSDIQRYEYEIAPTTSIQKLIYPEDKPKLPKKSADKIDYIPDLVLEQLFEHINDLHPEVILNVYVAFKSGLRISDVLNLKTDCLVRLNEKY